MKDWIGLMLLIAAFIITITIGGAVICFSQPSDELEDDCAFPSVIDDKKRPEVQGCLTKEQRKAIKEGRFDELNEV